MAIDLEKMTQEQCNELIAEANEEYEKAFKESGLSKAMFTVKSNFPMQYAQFVLTVEDYAKELGLTMPPLVEGVLVREAE